MRTRARFDAISLVWLTTAAIQIALIVERMHRHAVRNHPGSVNLASTPAAWIILDWISLIFWLAIAAIHLTAPWFTFWQVDANGVRYRRLGFTRKIPFSNIVAVREKDYSTGAPINGVEIEIARRGANVYPHQYLVAKPANREAFLKAMETFAPQALIEGRHLMQSTSR